MKGMFLIDSLFVFPVLAMNNNDDHGVPTFREIDAVAEGIEESCKKQCSIVGFSVPVYTEKRELECRKDLSRRYDSFVIINMINACLGKNIEKQFDLTKPKKDHAIYMHNLEKELEFSEFLSVVGCFNQKSKKRPD